MASMSLVAKPAGVHVPKGMMAVVRPSRRGGHRKGHRKHHGRRHGFFSRPWVWLALVVVLADALAATTLANLPKIISPRALLLWLYAGWKHSKSAYSIATVLQAAQVAGAMGLTAAASTALSSVNLGGGLFKPVGAPGGGGGGGLGGDLGSVLAALGGGGGAGSTVGSAQGDSALQGVLSALGGGGGSSAAGGQSVDDNGNPVPA